ncbi:MAG: type II restriction endonuclease [Synergistaceae bacterium]|nr:type II restriction endonuclease [Synergistaceae bacterium]MBR1602840.1 type II restriction endonuclease [Synergistaceae bacterium]
MRKNRDFSKWLDTFRPSINSYNYYADFEKIYRNAERFKTEIFVLNSIIGSKNIEQDFEKILTEYPKCIRAVPILLAVRNFEIYCQDENGAVNYDFKNFANSIEQYKYFMRKTGLFDLLECRLLNLYDYVKGVETGLDSNGRKNRGGKQMENLVEFYLKKSGAEYYKEIYLSEIEKKWKIDLSAISAQGTSDKRWDFAVKTLNKVFAIETNFYTDGGSKLNEIARSYKLIAEKAKQIKNFEFVWITDGKGWLKARHNLEETFKVLENLYNISDMESGIFNELFADN